MVIRSIHNPLEELTITSRIVGIHISGRKTSVVYGDLNGLMYERLQMETPVEQPFLAGFDAICELVDKLLKLCRAQGLSSPEVISVAVSGPLDRLKGVVMEPEDLPTWVDAQLKGRLVVRYNLPVFIEHRSRAAALAEWYYGAGAGTENMVLVDLEPVVSIGAVLMGQVYRGSQDAAGAIDKQPAALDGAHGSGILNDWVSGRGMARLAAERFPQRWAVPPDPYQLVQAVINGDSDAVSIVGDASRVLAQALNWVAALLAPEMIVIGHPGDVLGDAFLAPLRAAFEEGFTGITTPPRLVPARLGAKLDDLASLMAVISAFKQRTD